MRSHKYGRALSLFIILVCCCIVLPCRASRRNLQDIVLLEFPCLLARPSIEPNGATDVLFDWSCELDPREPFSNGSPGIILPIEGLQLSDGQEASIIVGSSVLFAGGYFVRDFRISIPPGSQPFVQTTMGGLPAPGPAPGPAPVPPTPPSVGGTDDDLVVGDDFFFGPVAFGEQTLLVVRVSAPDVNSTISALELGDGIFGTNGDPFTLTSQFDACSYGQFTVKPFEGTMNGKDIRNGVYETTLPYNVAAQDPNVVEIQTTLQLGSELGPGWLNDRGINFVMYCLPMPISDLFFAYAYFNNKISVYANDACTFPSAGMHEIGHNLNLEHSGQGGQDFDDDSFLYDDQSGMMGFSYFEDDTPVMCFNGAKSFQLGWYRDRHTFFDYATPFWRGDLYGVSDYTRSPAGSTVIFRAFAFEGDLYIVFNRADGINVGTLEGADRVLITSQSSLYDPSFLVADLGTGEAYVTAAADLKGNEGFLRVYIETIDLESSPAKASVLVRFDTIESYWGSKCSV